MKIIGFKVLSDIVALVAFYWGLSVQWHPWRCNYKLGLQRLNFRFLVPNKLERIFGLSNLAKNESVGGGQKVREWVQKISFFFSFFSFFSRFPFSERTSRICQVIFRMVSNTFLKLHELNLSPNLRRE